MWFHPRSTDEEVEGQVAVATIPQESTWAARAALLTLQIGAILSVLVVVTYKIFELDRFFVPKELVLHGTAFLSGLLSLGITRRIKSTRVDALLVCFIIWSTLSSIFATNVWAAGRSLALSISGVVLFWVARGLGNSDLRRPLLGGLSFMVILAAITSLLQAYGFDSELFSVNRMPGGTLGNRNFIAHLIALGIPVLLFSILTAGRFGQVLTGGVGLAIAITALILTRSRAAWLGVLALSVVMVLGFILTPSVRRDWKIIRRFVLLILFAGIGVAAALYLPNRLRWTSDSPYLDTARGVLNYNEGSGRGRLIQYSRTMKMALFNPVLGVGPGNWAVEYDTFKARNDPSMDRNEPGMTANPWPSSDWAAMLSERGLVGFLLLGIVWLAIMLGAWRKMRSSEEGEEGLQAVMLLATLVGTLTVGTFDAVLLLAWPTLFFWTAVGALLDPESLKSADTASGVRILVLLVLVLASGAGTLRSAGQLEAMEVYVADESRESLEMAARMDPGSFRLHVRLAHRFRRDREKRCEYALQASELYPHAAEAIRLTRGCN